MDSMQREKLLEDVEVDYEVERNRRNAGETGSDSRKAERSGRREREGEEQRRRAAKADESRLRKRGSIQAGVERPRGDDETKGARVQEPRAGGGSAAAPDG